MTNYQILSKKYRPQTFGEVKGQEHVVRVLKNAIAGNRVPNAYLFVGPRGVGKTSFARIVAKALNCRNGPTCDPCGECEQCLQISEGKCVDVWEIDGASNNGIDQIRELRESARFGPASGNFKIYIVDEVHMLSASAFNALLKTVEEPPAHVKFLFATTEAERLPATFTSRCQCLVLRPIREDTIAGHLADIAHREKIDLEPGAAVMIARAAGGGMRDAESMLDQAVSFSGGKLTESDILSAFGFISPAEIVRLLDSILRGDAAGALKQIEDAEDSGRDFGTMAMNLASTAKGLLLSEVGGGGRGEDCLGTLQGRVPVRRLAEAAAVLSEAESAMRFATDKKIPLEMAVFRCIQILHTADVDEVLDVLGKIVGDTRASGGAQSGGDGFGVQMPL